jgi:hypothetical protein
MSIKLSLIMEVSMAILRDRLMKYTAFMFSGQIRQWRVSRDDKGDVPGWVLVTIMTAGLVTALWAVAGDRLDALFTSALDSVSGPGQ